jgi:hypothetical protein
MPMGSLCQNSRAQILCTSHIYRTWSSHSCPHHSHNPCHCPQNDLCHDNARSSHRSLCNSGTTCKSCSGCSRESEVAIRSLEHLRGPRQTLCKCSRCRHSPRIYRTSSSHSCHVHSHKSCRCQASDLFQCTRNIQLHNRCRTCRMCRSCTGQ